MVAFDQDSRSRFGRPGHFDVSVNWRMLVVLVGTLAFWTGVALLAPHLI